MMLIRRDHVPVSPGSPIIQLRSSHSRWNDCSLRSRSGGAEAALELAFELVVGGVRCYGGQEWQGDTGTEASLQVVGGQGACCESWGALC
jgi:hypothetical protein